MKEIQYDQKKNKSINIKEKDSYKKLAKVCAQHIQQESPEYSGEYQFKIAIRDLKKNEQTDVLISEDLRVDQNVS